MFSCLSQEELILVNLKVVDLSQGHINDNQSTKNTILMEGIQIYFTQQEIDALDISNDSIVYTNISSSQEEFVLDFMPVISRDGGGFEGEIDNNDLTDTEDLNIGMEKIKSAIQPIGEWGIINEVGTNYIIDPLDYQQWILICIIEFPDDDRIFRFYDTDGDGKADYVVVTDGDGNVIWSGSLTDWAMFNLIMDWIWDLLGWGDFNL